MPATTVKGGKVKGEGRVISINAKYGFLAAQGINSKVFIIPSSLKLEAPFPPLTDELHVDDLVTFEAIEQAERNGARYLAIDGSVKLKQRGKDVMFEGDGKIVRLDAIRGCFGFIDSSDVGSVFFNISAVRPATSDVTKVLKLGQKVKFRALPNLEQPNCKWRASVVCAAAKAGEYLHVRPTATATVTPPIATTTPSIIGNNNGGSSLRPTVAVTAASTIVPSSNNSSCTTDSVAGMGPVIASEYHLTVRPTSTAVTTSAASTTTSITATPLNNGLGCPSATNSLAIGTSAALDNEYLHQHIVVNPTAPAVTWSSAVVTPPPSNNNVVGNAVNGTSANNTAVNNINIFGPSFGDTELNPAVLWELYLEQHQKALSQNFSLF